MRRFISVRVIIAAFFSIGLILALSIFLPLILKSVERQEEHEIFLTPGLFIAAEIKVDEAAHFLGEPFPVVLLVQYKPDVIEIKSTTFTAISFAPFERVGSAELNKSALTDAITEYRYSLALQAIMMIPGELYQIEPLVLEYVLVASDQRQHLVVSFPHALQVNSEYEDAENLPFGPLMGVFYESHIASELFFVGAALIFSIFFILIVFIVLMRLRSDKNRKHTNGNLRELRQLREFLDRCMTPSFFETSHRARLRELQTQAVYWANYLSIVEASAFFQYRNSSAWHALHEALEHAWKSNEPNVEHVKTASGAFESIFVQHLEPLMRSKRRRFMKKKRGEVKP